MSVYVWWGCVGTYSLEPVYKCVCILITPTHHYIQGLPPNVELIKAREVKFDAFIKAPLRRTRETISPASTENEDEDEKTNRIASRRPSKTTGQSLTPQYPLSPASEARRPHSTGSETDSSDGGVDLLPGCWVVDGDVTNMSSIEIRFASITVLLIYTLYAAPFSPNSLQAPVST